MAHFHSTHNLDSTEIPDQALPRPSVATRCDLHLHSAASLSSGEWFSEYFHAPESYAEPQRQYELCKARGMTLVTLTDHDTIDGGLQLVGHSDFFLSVEVSTKFPENDCAIHVLAYNVTPDQHAELQRRRASVYDVSSYLRAECLAHTLPHPLLSPNWKLDASTLEKCLVLFPTFEAMNAFVDCRIDSDLAHFFSSITPGVLEMLSSKHGIPLMHGSPARLALTAGSDDHGHRRCGTVFTEVDGILDDNDYLAQVMRGNSRLVGNTGDLDAMAICIKQTAYAHFRRRPESDPSRRNPLTDVMDIVAGRAITSDPRCPPSTADNLLRAVLANGVPAGVELDISQTPEQPSPQNDRKIVDAVIQASDALAGQAAKDLASSLIASDIYGIFAALSGLASAACVASPLLFAADHYARQEAQVRRIWSDWTATERPLHCEYLAVFSDTVNSVDGVSSWCNRFTKQATLSGKRVWFAACDPPNDIVKSPGNDRPLNAIARFALPFYSGFELTVPSLAAMVDRLWRERVTHVEVATPGPMGLIGLAAARILRLPVTASYHTDLADLAQILSQEPKLADLSRSYLRWFYRSVDRVFVFSEVSRAKLAKMDIPGESIVTLPIAVDTEDFSPGKSSSTVFSELGLRIGARPVVLSVGRLSVEKNVRSIIDAVELLQGRTPAPFLIVVGDGPTLTELQRHCIEKNFVAFVGFQEGEVLRQLYASADAFVFASRSDTLGLVNLESLASGAPLLVPAGSAITESLRNGHNASFYDPTPGGLSNALGRLLDDPPLAAALAGNGRQYTLGRWEEAEFEAVWKTMISAGSSQAVS